LLRKKKVRRKKLKKKRLVAFWNRPDIIRQCPLLRLVALRCLACPAASSFSERIFSTAGLASAGKRSSLAPWLVEAMLMVRHDFHWLAEGEAEAPEVHGLGLQLSKLSVEGEKEEELEEGEMASC